MASLNLWLDESSELAVYHAPSGTVPLGLADLQDYLHGLRVEGVNVNPDALVKHVVEGLQRVLITLFLCQPILLSPKAISGPRGVFLHGSCPHCELGQVVFISSEFFIWQNGVQSGEAVEQGGTIRREILLMASLSLSDPQAHQKALGSKPHKKVKELLLQSSRWLACGWHGAQLLEYFIDQGSKCFERCNITIGLIEAWEPWDLLVADWEFIRLLPNTHDNACLLQEIPWWVTLEEVAGRFALLLNVIVCLRLRCVFEHIIYKAAGVFWKQHGRFLLKYGAGIHIESLVKLDSRLLLCLARLLRLLNRDLPVRGWWCILWGSFISPVTIWITGIARSPCWWLH